MFILAIGIKKFLYKFLAKRNGQNLYVWGRQRRL